MKLIDILSQKGCVRGGAAARNPWDSRKVLEGRFGCGVLRAVRWHRAGRGNGQDLRASWWSFVRLDLQAWDPHSDFLSPPLPVSFRAEEEHSSVFVPGTAGM